MNKLSYLTRLIEKFASHTAASEKLSHILRHGKMPYIKYTGDHAVFDEGTHLVIIVDLMSSPEDTTENRKNMPPDLEEASLNYMVSTLSRELMDAFPGAKIKVSNSKLGGDEVMVKEIELTVPQTQIEGPKSLW